MLFKYQALTKEGDSKGGSIEANNKSLAINALQQRGLTIVSIESTERRSLFNREFFVSRKAPVRDLVILSRQIATLFSAQVSVLRTFRMLSEETENAALRTALSEITRDIQGGSGIGDALAKHPLIFSNFYTNMVRSGEESGNLNKTFEYLADHLDRNYELTTKARNALLYPAFIIFVFVGVMILLLTVIFPKLATILDDVGQEIPFYTKMIIAASDFLINYGIFLLALLILAGFLLWRLAKEGAPKMYLSKIKLSLPITGGLATKFYLSRISDNLFTMLTSGVSIIRALEITASVVDDAVYEAILKEATEDVKGGALLSETLGKHEEIPGIMIQIIRAGEETGELGPILKTLADFYRKEAYNTVDGLLSLIEPVLIVGLGLGVGLVVASVLIPIYSITGGF